MNMVRKYTRNITKKSSLSGTFQHPFFWLYLVVTPLISIAPLISRDVSHAYVDAWPFNRYWVVAGKGIVTKTEKSTVKWRTRGRLHAFNKVYFTWQTHGNKELHGICISFERHFFVGDEVDICVYKKDPQKAKIEGTYITTTPPGKFRGAFLPAIVFLFFFFVLIKLLSPSLKKKNNKSP